MKQAQRAIARPYARAAFAWSKRERTVERWRLLLENLSRLSQIRGIRELQGRYPPSLVCAVLMELIQGELTQPERNFIQTVSQYKRLLWAPAIAELFADYHDRDQGVRCVSLWTALPLKNEQKGRFQALIARQLGPGIRLLWNVDSRQRSGIVVRIGDWVVDASGLGRLHALCDALRSPAVFK